MTQDKWVFKPVTLLSDKLKQVQQARSNSADPLAKFHAGDDVYKRIYQEGLRRLSRPDMLTLNQAAARMSVTPDEYVAKAEQGQVILIMMQGKGFAPAWSFCPDGQVDAQVDALKVDIAREFEAEGRSYFKFLDYFNFMTQETASINETLPKGKLKDMFRRAGLQEFKCSAIVSATMNQLADKRNEKPEFWNLLVHHLDTALIHGGWDAQGGLSRAFRDKYGIPGQTLSEGYDAAIQNQPKP